MILYGTKIVCSMKGLFFPPVQSQCSLSLKVRWKYFFKKYVSGVLAQKEMLRAATVNVPLLFIWMEKHVWLYRFEMMLSSF